MESEVVRSNQQTAVTLQSQYRDRQQPLIALSDLWKFVIEQEETLCWEGVVESSANTITAPVPSEI